MTFALSGTTITQTGFDASLAGLSGISGVTVSGEALGKFRYLLTGRQLIINGSLIIDPEIECLEFDTTSALVNFTYNGKVQIGRKRASAGEITTVTTTAATGLGGKYFTFNDGTTSFYVWFTVDGVGTDPAPGGTGILCAVLGTDTNAQVATKIQDAIMSRFALPFPLVDASATSNVVTIRNNNNVTVTDATAATSGFTVTVTQQGSNTGTIRYSDGDAIIFSRQVASAPNDLILAANADNTVFLGYGGRITSGGPVCFVGGNTSAITRSGTLIIEALHYYARLSTAGVAVQFRVQHTSAGNVNIRGLTLDCDPSISSTQPSIILFSAAAPNFFSANFKCSQIQNASLLAGPTGDFTFDNLQFGSNFRTADVVGNFNINGGSGSATPVWTLRNTDVGTATRFTFSGAAAINTARLNAQWIQTVNARLRDSANNPITSNALIWLTETNDGQRFDTNGRTGFNWLTVQTYSQSVDGTGTASTTVRLGIGYVSRETVNVTLRSYFGKSTADNFDIYAVGYLYNIASGEHILRGINGYTYTQPMVTDASITQTNRTTVDAYTSIDTPAQFYDRAKSWLLANYVGQTATLVTRSVNTINAGSRNVVIDATAASVFSVAGSTITIKSSAFVGNLTTTGTITLANGATFTGARTDATGTITSASLTVNNVVNGSRLLIRRTDTQATLVNQTVSGTSFVYAYSHTTNIPVEIVVRKATGSPAYQEWRTTTTLTAVSASVTANQVLDE